MTPDESTFRADLKKPAFLLGVAEGRWRLISFAWPYVVIGVIAADGLEFAVRFDGTGYPEGTTGRLWDPALNAPPAPAGWPKHKGGRVGAVFRTDWRDGSALYFPCDREAIAGHDTWRTQFPEQVWSRQRGITHYLELVYELLHSGDYVSRPRPAA